jgi:cytochrome d ubiquinol oxidase subunit II
VIAVPFIVRAGRDGLAFAATTLTIGLMTATIFLNLYPRVMVSSTNTAYDLTVWNSSSSHYTLAVMTVVALSLLPGVLLYQAWTYYVFRHRIGRDDLGPVRNPIDILSSKGQGSADTPSGD